MNQKIERKDGVTTPKEILYLVEIFPIRVQPLQRGDEDVYLFGQRTSH